MCGEEGGEEGGKGGGGGRNQSLLHVNALSLSLLVFSNIMQCSKLKVHPAQDVHNLAARCTHFHTCAPGECILFQSIFLQYIGLYAQKKKTVARFCVPLHPICAHKKGLRIDYCDQQRI